MSPFTQPAQSELGWINPFRLSLSINFRWRMVYHALRSHACLWDVTITIYNTGNVRPTGRLHAPGSCHLCFHTRCWYVPIHRNKASITSNTRNMHAPRLT
jgi:hypothetical protein